MKKIEGLTDTEIQEAAQKLRDAESQLRAAQSNLRTARDELDLILNGNGFPWSTKPYWFLFNYGKKWEVRSAKFGDGSKVCRSHRAAGNCYRTKDKAQEVADIRNALTAKMEGWV
jgi:hypothetical protein